MWHVCAAAEIFIRSYNNNIRRVRFIETDIVTDWITQLDHISNTDALAKNVATQISKELSYVAPYLEKTSEFNITILTEDEFKIFFCTGIVVYIIAVLSLYRVCP